MNIAWGTIDPRFPIIDLLSKTRQIFQGEIPEIRQFVTSKISKADAILVPHDVRHWDSRYLEYIEVVSQTKPLLAFNRSDRPLKCQIKNLYLLQVAMPVNRRNPNAVIIPYNISPLQLSPRTRTAHPIISFVGYVKPNNILSSIHRSIRSPLNPIKGNGVLIRKRGLKEIESRLSHQIIQRNHYGGAKSLISDPNEFRTKFESAIYNSDFTFCPRGDANGSQRFYEVLSAGRVPIVPNSKVQYPKVMYKEKLSISIECSTLASDIVNQAYSFWDSLSVSDYYDIQQQNANFYKTKLDYRVFMSDLFQNEWTSFVNNYTCGGEQY
jgi:hypothetical protein